MIDSCYVTQRLLGFFQVIDVELEKEIEVKPVVKTFNGPSVNQIDMETNITIPEFMSPIKKEIKQEKLSPKSTNSRTPNKNLSTSQSNSTDVSKFSPNNKQSNMTLTLGTLGSLTSRSINKTGAAEGEQTGTPINGLKQKLSQGTSSSSGSDGTVSKHSSELQKILLQSTPSSLANSSQATQGKVTQVVQSVKGIQKDNSSTVIPVNSGKVNSQNTKSPQKCVVSQGGQPPSVGQVSLPPTQLPSGSLATPAQTLYIRCKDNQGNIFLVPHHLLKTVPGTPTTSPSVNSQISKGTVPSPKTTPTKATLQKQSNVILTENPTKVVSSSPAKPLTSNTTVQPILVSQATSQLSLGAKAVFQKPPMQNSPLLIRSSVPVTKSNIAPASSLPSPVLLIKTEVSPARPALTAGQPIKTLDKNEKEVQQPSQLQLHLQGQISQNQLKVTSQGLKSVQPAGKSKVSKQMETVTLIQKSDSNLENKIPSKTCQLASLLKGDISAAHRNAVKQVSLVTGVNTTSAQVLASQNTSQNILVQKTVVSSKDTSNSNGGMRIVKNSGDASVSGDQAVKVQQTSVGMLPQAIPISAPSKTMHSVILVNQDISKVPVNAHPSRTINHSVSAQCAETVMLSSSVRYSSVPSSSATTLATAPANTAKQQTVRPGDSLSGFATGSKEPMKTVIAKIGTQTLLLQLPVSDSGTVNKSVDPPKASKPPVKKVEVPSNAALIETLKKQAAEKEAKMRAAARMSYMERKLGVPVRMDSKDEKRIHKWKKKTPPEEKMLGLSRYQEEDLGPVKAVDPLR